MLKKVIGYFILSATVIASAAMYFITKETSPDTVTITGEYDIWATEPPATSVSTKITSSLYQTEIHIKTTENYVETATITETVTEITTEFLYININTASAEDFMKLDGIGEKKARDIVNYRNAVSGFDNIEEIMNVKGIGEMTFYNIRNHIYVENPVYHEDVTEEPTPESIQEPVQESDVYIETPVELQTDIPETMPPAIEEEYDATEAFTSDNTTETVLYFELNTVTAEELMLIPEIDEELAKEIIDFRTSIQYFSNVYELLYVNGMSDERFVKIADYFYVISTNSEE